MTHFAANDNARGPSTRGTSKGVWTAIGTIRRGLGKGTPAGMKSARAAAAYAWPYLSVPVPIPESDAAGTWANVVRFLEATARRIDAEALELREMLAR